MLNNDSKLVLEALLVARKLHLKQIDDEGKPYMNHIWQVYHILSQVTKDEEVLAAGLLHDTIEDTEYTQEELLKTFGQRVHDLVMEVTHEGKADNHGFYFPRLHSKEGILIKFADRLSNLTRMGSWDPERVEHYLKRSKFWKSDAPSIK
jgi:(p)ppGpp synthase/HD superfamily hydrolase